MTDDKIAPRALVDQHAREMVGFAAECLIALETQTLCAAALSAERINHQEAGLAPVREIDDRVHAFLDRLIEGV